MTEIQQSTIAESRLLSGPNALRNWAILVAASLTVMAGATIAPGLPGLQAHFADVPNADVLSRVLLTTHGLAIAIIAPLGGLLVDRVGRRPMLIGAALLYGLAGTAGLWLDDLIALLVSRALLGAAVAVTMTVATTLVGDLFVGEERDRFVGLQSAAMAAGGIVFMLGGGVLAELSWRGPFLIYGLAFLLVPLALVALPRSGPSTPTTSLQIDTARAGTTQTRVIVFLYGLGFLNQVSFYMLPTQLPFLVASSFDDGAATLTGALIATQTLFAAFAALNFGHLHKRMSRHALFAVGFGGTALAYTLLSQFNGPPLFAIMALAGLAGGLMTPNLQSWIVGAVSSDARGRVVGGLSSVTFLGQFMSPIILAPVVSSFGLQGAFLAAAAFLSIIAAGLAALAIRGHRVGWT